MLLAETLAKKKYEMNIKLNERLDEIRALDNTVNENNTLTDSGKRLILLALTLHLVIMGGVITKDLSVAVFMIRTFKRIMALKEMEDRGCMDMLNEMESM